MEVFARHGFRASALAEVAERVDLTPAGILYHFGSKESLLLAVIAERDARAGQALVETQADGALATLAATVRFAEQSEREPGLTALHTVLQAESFEADAPAHDYFRQRSRTLRAIVEATVVQGRADGEIRADVDPAAIAAQVVAFLEGAAVLWLIDDTVSLVDLYRDYFATLATAIGALPT